MAGADLSGWNLSDVVLNSCDLSKANLRSTILIYTELISSDLSGADLSNANLQTSRLIEANLSSADLSGADLRAATLQGTNLTNANLTGCYVYATSVWDVQLDNAIQSNLNITRRDEPTITVDNLEVAQFIHLLLQNYLKMEYTSINCINLVKPYKC